MANKNWIDSQRSATVKLIVYPRRRIAVAISLILMLCVFSYLIANSIFRGNGSWVSILFPVSLIGVLAVFILPVEEWSYMPWQEASQKYEKNIYD